MDTYHNKKEKNQKIRIHKVNKMQEEVRPYTTILNDLMKKPELSYKALGLAGFILSHDPYWKINPTYLASRKKDARSSVDSGLKELKKHGYLQITYLRNNKGHFDGELWEFFEDPNLNPHFNKPNLAFPLSGNGTYKKKNNKELESKDSSKSKADKGNKQYQAEKQYKAKNLWERLVNQSTIFGMQLIDNPSSMFQKSCETLQPDVIDYFQYELLFNTFSKDETVFIEVFHTKKDILEK